MKSVGNSSIDADMGMLTKTADDGSKTITGMLADNMQPMRTTDAVTGVPFVAKTTNDGAACDGGRRQHLTASPPAPVAAGKPLG